MSNNDECKHEETTTHYMYDYTGAFSMGLDRSPTPIGYYKRCNKCDELIESERFPDEYFDENMRVMYGQTILDSGRG